MRRYGAYGTGMTAEDEARCIAGLEDRSFGWPELVQCARKRGHGPGGLYCKQHAKMLAQDKSVPVGREEEK